MRTSNTVCSPQVLGSQVALNMIRKQVISLPTLGPRTNSAPQVALTSPKHTHRQASTILVSSYMDIYTLICPPLSTAYAHILPSICYFQTAARITTSRPIAAARKGKLLNRSSLPPHLRQSQLAIHNPMFHCYVIACLQSTDVAIVPVITHSQVFKRIVYCE